MSVCEYVGVDNIFSAKTTKPIWKWQTPLHFASQGYLGKIIEFPSAILKENVGYPKFNTLQIFFQSARERKKMKIVLYS